MKPKRRFSVIRRLLAFFSFQRPREGKGKPSGRTGSGLSQSFSGQSPKYETYSYTCKYETYSYTCKSVDDSDYPVEVFLDEDGNIKQPLEQGFSFKYCSIDRWYMPDCVPGIQSIVDVDGKYFVRSCNITVIFANDKYILLTSNEASYIEPGHEYFDIVEAHFVKRGIEHLVDNIPSSFSSWWDNNNGRSNKTVSVSNNKSPRRNYPNIKITNRNPAYTEFTYINSPKTKTIKTAPGTWVWSEG